jgi:hypothetical protein
MQPNNKAGQLSSQDQQSPNSGHLPRLAHTGKPPPKLPKEKKPHFECTLIKPSEKLPTPGDGDPAPGGEQVGTPTDPPPPTGTEP